MNLIILLIGLVFALAGLFLLVKPAIILIFLKTNRDRPYVYILAVLARLLIGVLLIAQAYLAKIPLSITALGWLFIVGGLLLAVIGRHRFRRLLSWVLDRFEPYSAVGGAAAIILGGYLIAMYI